MTGPMHSGRRLGFARLGVAILVTVATAALPASALAKQHAKHEGKRHHAKHGSDDHAGGFVYSATNDPNGNAVNVFKRNSSTGGLTLVETVPTGGHGLAAQPPFTFSIVDSSDSMTTARNGQLLFVVNDGKRDNTITAFRATDDGLRRVQVVSSGGTLPVSLAVSGNLLYVVNERSANIFGYRISSSGHLRAISNSSRQLSQQFPSQPNGAGGVAAQIGFSPDGRHVVVTARGLPSHQGVIDTFEVQSDGSTAEPQEFTAGVDPNPFGFSFTNAGQLLVSNVGFVGPPINYPEGNVPGTQLADPTQFRGSASSYSVSSSGAVTPITTEVPSGGRGACWLVLSKDQHFAFVTNTLSAAMPGSGIGAVTTYAVGAGGTLTYVTQTNSTPGGNPTDMSVSPDGRFLYMLNPGVFGPPSGIDVFKIGPGGSLTLQPGSVTGLPTGESGLVAAS